MDNPHCDVKRGTPRSEGSGRAAKRLNKKIFREVFEENFQQKVDAAVEKTLKKKYHEVVRILDQYPSEIDPPILEREHPAAAAVFKAVCAIEENRAREKLVDQKVLRREVEEGKTICLRENFSKEDCEEQARVFLGEKGGKRQKK